MDARFPDYQARLLRIARHMEQLNQAIQLRARQPSSEGELTPLAHTLTQVCVDLIRSTLVSVCDYLPFFVFEFVFHSIFTIFHFSVVLSY